MPSNRFVHLYMTPKLPVAMNSSTLNSSLNRDVCNSRMLTLVTSPLSTRRLTTDGWTATGDLWSGGVHCPEQWSLTSGQAVPSSFDPGPRFFRFFNMAIPVGVNGFTDTRNSGAILADPSCRARGAVTATNRGVDGGRQSAADRGVDGARQSSTANDFDDDLVLTK